MLKYVYIYLAQDLNPFDFNESKRKRLGSAIQDSFLHPKLIKTNKIIFQKTSEPKKMIGGAQTQSKKVKHKFQFY